VVAPLLSYRRWFHFTRGAPQGPADADTGALSGGRRRMSRQPRHGRTTVTVADALKEAVARTQALPYTWPAPPDAASTRAAGAGTCAGKHAVLREDLDQLGLETRRLMVVGRLVPALWPDLLAGAEDLLEVHECLTVATAWAGPLLVDVTWHPAAVRAGLPGTLDWDVNHDMICAVEPVASHAVADDVFRQQKELLRGRLYTPARRAQREELLAEMARRAALL
jgi:hypothetical protein